MSQGKRVRLSKRGLSYRARKTWAQAGRYALYFVSSPSHCCRRRIVALTLSLLPRLDRPVAAALRATAKARKRIPFRLRPRRGPLVGRFLFSENVRHGPGHQPGRGGRVAAVAVGSPVRAMCEGHADRKVYEEPDCPWTKSIAEQAERRPSSPVGAHTANRQRAAIVLTRARTGRGAWCWSCAGWQTWGSCASSAGTWRSGPAPIWDGRRASR